MSEDDTELEGAPHPRETAVLFGHMEAEQELLESYRSGRMPHAWLIGGEAGIGKATLAYRMARFVLAHPDPKSSAVQKAKSVAIKADDPLFRRVAGEAHSDLLVLERRLNDKGKLSQDIAVDDVRRTVSFFGSTAGEGGWRVAIVDALDELNRFGANALLKVMEEPPARSLLVMISHTPGQVMPTIRSRARRLTLRPLSTSNVIEAAAAASGRAAADKEIIAAATAANGSVARALDLLEGPALALREKTAALLDQLPQTDSRALHALGEAIGGTSPQTLAVFLDTVNEWLSARLQSSAQDTKRLARFAETWEKVNRAAHDADEYNLERKPLVFSVFGLLAEAARG